MSTVPPPSAPAAPVPPRPLAEPEVNWILAIPESYLGAYGAGHWKDLASLRVLLAEAAGPGAEFIYNGRNLADLIALAGTRPVHIVWYYSFHPEELATLRAACPAARLHVRTVNAESLQHLARNPPGWMPNRGNLRILYGAVRVAWRDSRCRRLADTLPGISAHDNRVYWSRLPGRARVVDAPYVCPWPRLRPEAAPRSWDKREKLIVCLAGGRDRISLAGVNGFLRLAGALAADPCFRGWTFALTGGVQERRGGDDFPVSTGVVHLGRVDEPWDLICRARAVTVLTPLGHGCKTTVLDALAAGTHAIVHPVLAPRLGLASGGVTACDPENPGPAGALLARLEAGGSGPDLHARVREQALAAWRSVLSPRVPGGGP